MGDFAAGCEVVADVGEGGAVLHLQQEARFADHFLVDAKIEHHAVLESDNLPLGFEVLEQVGVGCGASFGSDALFLKSAEQSVDLRFLFVGEGDGAAGDVEGVCIEDQGAGIDELLLEEGEGSLGEFESRAEVFSGEAGSKREVVT